MKVFKDRRDAGVQLAHALHSYGDDHDTIVLAHTRGSVPVAYEVATRLGLPLDVLGEEEFAHPDAAADAAIAGKRVLLVDDGEATRDMPLIVEWLRARGAA